MPTPAHTLLIGGVDVARTSRETFAVLNPLTGSPVSYWPNATLADCTAAVEGCHLAQPAWERVLPAQKRAIFLLAADLVQSVRYESRIKEAMESETSAHANWIMVNIKGSASLLKEAAAQAGALKGDTFKSESPTVDMFVSQRRAAGVVLALSPWNSPILLAFRAVAIPLICGNGVVLKCSEFSPECGRIVVDILLEAGVPRTVLSYLAFDRSAAPARTAALISHPAIKRVNFTGSDSVGRTIAEQCGRELKQCVLELGGSAPTIVFADADLSQAAKAVVSGGMLHAGQVCMSSERIFVEESASAAFVEELKGVARTWMSSPSSKKLSSEPTIPPVLNPASATRIRALVALAVEQGATDLLADPSRSPSPSSSESIVRPSILINVTPSMDITRAEIFGPVITITTFSTEESATLFANSSEYSLMASLWTRDLHRAMRVAPQIRSGSVQVNGSTIHSEPAFGLAGLGGASGYGRFNVDSFTDLRTIVFHGPEAKFPMM